MKTIEKFYRKIGAERLWAAVIAGVLLTVVGCGREAPVERFDRQLAVADFSQHVRALAADEMQGRTPSSPGEELTIAYLESQYRKLGLKGPIDGGYRQPVPLVATTAKDVTPMTIASSDSSLTLNPVADVMVWTKRNVPASGIENSDVIFVGYGIVAPEHGWDDYSGLDVAGKTVIILVNDPGFATQDPEVFSGNAMTYYGRWTYKYEEAARQGAAGAIVVHETAAAGYPWDVVSSGWDGERFDLVAEDRNMSRIAVEGWITRPAAERLFSLAGADYDELKARAATRDFTAVQLPVTASVSFENDIRVSASQNVVGFIPGSARPDEYIVYTAHWDHLGLDADEAAPDRVYNGAKDNAAGVAYVLGVAKAFSLATEPPERSVVFVMVTAEESGLLGSAWYARHPIFPLERTVANINIDSPTLLGPTDDVTVIGYGNSELEDWLDRQVLRQGRRLEPEPSPEKGRFYRSDHFNFSKRGVPALYAKGGVEHREHGREFGLKWEADYGSNRYHKVSDEFDPDWDLRGVGEDMELYYLVGSDLAASPAWPNWREGNEFRRIRDASAAARSAP